MRTLGILRLLSSVLICLVVSPRLLHSQTGIVTASHPDASNSGAKGSSAAGDNTEAQSSSTQFTVNQSKRNHLISALQDLPLQFEENKGQADSRARFLARGAGYTLLLNPDGLALNLAHSPNSSAQSLSMHLLGAQKADLAGRDQTATHTNYYIGKDPLNWHLDVRSYRSVAYTGVYKGIDLVYHGSGSQLEYDFVVSPGADAGQVRMSFDGLKPTLQGKDLSFEGQNQLSVRALKAFQMLNGEKKAVEADWEIQGDQASIHLGPYDRSRELTIDPVFFYGAYIGGSLDDAAVSIVPASQPGYFYVALSTDSVSISEPSQLAVNGNCPNDYLTVCSTATLILGLNATNAPAPPSPLPPFSNADQPLPTLAIGSATYIGGNAGVTMPTGMVADSNSNLYVTGTTTDGASFPQLGTQVCSQSCNGFIAKFATSLDTSSGSATVTLQYSFGLPANPLAIAVDSSGDSYLTGTATTFTGANTLTIPAGDLAFQQSAAAAVGQTQGPHAFLMELDPNGATLFCSYIGGSGSDQGNAIALSGNNVFVAGRTSSTDFPATSVAVQKTNGGGQDAFLLAGSSLSTSPSLTFSTYLGGSGNDTASSIAVAPSGNIVVAGSTSSTQFPVQIPAQTNPHTFSALSWPVVVPSSGVPVLPTTPPTLVPLPGSVPQGAQDAFVTTLSADGTQLFFTDFLGGLASNLTTTSAQALAVDSAGVIYVTGTSTATALNGIAGNGEFLSESATEDLRGQAEYQGVSNVFFSEIDPSGQYLLEATLAGGAGTDQPGGLSISPPSASAGTASIVGVTAPATGDTDFPGLTLFLAAGESELNPVAPNAPSKNTQTNTAGFFVQEALAGYCNMQLTQQVGTSLTFSGPCVSGTQSGTLFATAANSTNVATLLTAPIAVTTSGNSLSATVTVDLSSLGAQTLDFTFGFLPLGAIGGVGTCQTDGSTISGCGIATSGGGGGTIFNVTSGTLAVALTCTGATPVTGPATTCAYNNVPNTALVGQPVTLNAAITNGVPNTVTWSSSQGTFTGPNPSTSITFTPGGTGGPVVVTAIPVANPALAPAPTITLSALVPTSVAFSSPGPFPYGQTTINVSVISSAGPTSTPAGTIAYQVDGGTNGTGNEALSGGTASIPLTGLSAGSHTLAVTYPTSGFFAGATNTSTFTVNQAALTVTAVTPPAITFGQPIPTLTYAITGFVNGDTSQVVNGTATLTTTATSTSAPGTYPITFATEGLAATNYTFSYVNGTLTINSIGAAPAPIISPAGGTFTTAQAVTLADSVAGAKLYYTTDGTPPTSSSALYAGPITVTATGTIRAIAVATGYTTSAISTATFTLSAPTLSAPSISFGNITEGTTSGTQTVILTNPGANPLARLTFALGGTNAGDFALGSATTCGTSLAAGSSCSVALTFTPSALGARSATLSFSYIGIGSPLTLTLGGTGLSPLAITSNINQIVAGTTFQFTASAPAIWTASAGTITASGFFTAPNPPPAPATVTITATSTTNPQIVATTQVTIVPAPAVVVPPTTTLPVGGSVSIPITIGAGTGIPGESLLLACVPASLPSGVTCSFTPNPVINAAGGSTATLVLTSSALTSGLRPYDVPWSRYPLDGSLIAVAGCVFFVSRKKVGGKKIMMLAVMLASAALLSMTACGTSGSFSRTTQQGFVTGAYTINVSVSGDSPGSPDFNQTLTIFKVTVNIQ